MSLCETFRELAFSTWGQLSKARRTEHQPLEETLTDINLLELKDRHADEVYTKTFTRPQEGITGADWEWWFTDAHMRCWLGFRVQAKVLKLVSNRFEHLHYKKGKTYQLSKLKREASGKGLIPLYCTYSHWDNARVVAEWTCFSFGHAPESYGCALVPLTHIQALQKHSLQDSLNAVIGGAVPWHCLVCCAGYGGNDLPNRAWNFVQATFNIKSTRRRRRDAPPIGVREQPPPYVRMVVEAGEHADELESDRRLRGILVIREGER